MSDVEENLESVKNFRNMLSNVNHVDRNYIRGIIQSCLNPSLREKYLSRNYERAAINVDLLISLTDTKQFQAMSMLARSIFEISVEMKLINLAADAAEKIDLFDRIEKLKASTKVLDYKKEHPAEEIHTETYRQFVEANASQIRAEQKAMWPGAKKVDHWTLKHLSARAEELGGIFERTYKLSYKEFSWLVHGGVTGVLHLDAHALSCLAGMSYKIASDAYVEILKVMVVEFKLSVADEIIYDRIEHAQLDAMADTPELKRALLRDMGLKAQNPP